jgi:hypothetical protein
MAGYRDSFKKFPDACRPPLLARPLSTLHASSLICFNTPVYRRTRVSSKFKDQRPITPTKLDRFVLFQMLSSYKRLTAGTSLTRSVLRSREDLNEPPTSSSVEIPSLAFLLPSLTSHDPDQIIPSLSYLSLLPSTLFSISGLPDLLLTLLSDTSSPDVHSLCFRILSTFLTNPDHFSLLPELPLVAALESFRALLMTPSERSHELRLYHFLKFAASLSRFTIATYRFDRFISLLQRCLDARCPAVIVRQCYRLSFEILSHNQRTDLAFLDHDFVGLSFRYINTCLSNVQTFSEHDRDKAFCIACEFLRKLCLNNCEVVDYLPHNLMPFCAHILDLCNNAQSEAFFGLLHGMAMNHILFPMFFSKPFVRALVEAMNERPFRIAFESVVMLTTMMKEAPELMGECIFEIGTFDGFVRFFDTQNVALIEDILIGVWALTNRFLVNRPDLNESPELLSLFQHSEEFVEEVKKLIELGDDHEKYISQSAMESAGMLMTALSHEFDGFGIWTEDGRSS